MISFDIFDTLITRRTLLPTGIFLCMQQEMKEHMEEWELQDYVLHNFALLRENAEKYARYNMAEHKSEEVTLQDIYEVLDDMTDIGSETSERLMELEIKFEIENSVGIQRNIKKIHKFLQQGECVILISDMYLSEKVIKQILGSVDEQLAKLPLFVSSEYKKTKRYGSLYPLVKEKMGISYRGWVHYGDNEQSDIKMAELLGIQAVRVSKPIIKEWEQELFEIPNIKNDVMLQCFLGTIQNILWNNELLDVERIGVAYGGGLLYPYVDWVINTCRERGYRKLYFIARDGYVLKKIADEIIKANEYEICTKYIYGSRQAWQTKENREIIVRYLKQEIDLSDERFAFVDLQGTGKTMQCVSELLGDILTHPLTVFYYQMFPHGKTEGCNFLICSFLRKVSHLEVFARAPHGATIGYQVKGDWVEPILDSVSAKLWAKSGIEEYVHGVTWFAKEFAKVSKEMPWMKKELMKLGQLVEQQINDSRDEKLLDFIGDMPHNSTKDDTLYAYAPKLTQKDIFRIFMWRTSEEIREVYSGNEFAVSQYRMTTNQIKKREFLQRKYYGMIGRFLHKCKHFCEVKRKIPSYEKIVIYAAGQEGQRLYNYITYQTRSQVVAWTDINYKTLQQKGFPVIGLNEALEKEHDVLVLAVMNDVMCEAIRQMLISLGEKSERIIQLEDFYGCK